MYWLWETWIRILVFSIFVGLREAPSPPSSFEYSKPAHSSWPNPGREVPTLNGIACAATGLVKTQLLKKKHPFRAINDAFKTPSKLGSMECDSAEELRSSSGVRLKSNIVCDVRLPPTPALVLLPWRAAGNRSHGIVRFGHSMQSTNTKRVHPSRCVRSTEQVWRLT